MQFSRFFLCLALLLLPIALLGTTWLYFYPVFHSCAFPTPPPTLPTVVAPFRLLALGDPQIEGDSSLPDPDAPIFPSVGHLIPDLREASSWARRKELVLVAVKGIIFDARGWLEGKRKAVDLWGNDWYLAHIVRTLRLATKPTHIAVLGDLLGSQWVTDGEFNKRAERYWGIVMRGLDKVPDHIFGAQDVDPQNEAQEERQVDSTKPAQSVDTQEDGAPYKEDSGKKRMPTWGGTTEILGADKAWETRVINIAGNHDVGYAGDLDESRIERFERAFGSVNWDIWFTLPDNVYGNNTAEPPPALRLVIFNTMNLDTPAWSSDLQTETYAFTNHIITTSRPVQDKTHATVLLTHIPLEKEEGVCVDSPYFDFFEDGHGVKEQNMLSGHASKIILEGIFGKSGNKDAEGAGLGREGVVINGHDHAGCDVLHFVERSGVESDCKVEYQRTLDADHQPIVPVNEDLPIVSREHDMLTTSPNMTKTSEDSAPKSDSLPQWHARRYPLLPTDMARSNRCGAMDQAPHLREITLRSMMGEYSGYAGFLSAWFDTTKGEKGEWVLEFASCGVGVQHWWWGVHILDVVLVACVAGWGFGRAWESACWKRMEKGAERVSGKDKEE